MCLGIPMQVVSCEGSRAYCNDGTTTQLVDTSLVGEQAEGTWLLVFLGAAREVLSAERALQMRDALAAVAAVMSGSTADLDSLFADLTEREPQLPEHLRNDINN